MSHPAGEQRGESCCAQQQRGGKRQLETEAKCKAGAHRCCTALNSYLVVCSGCLVICTLHMICILCTGTAAKQRNSLCPAVAPGDRSSRKGHLAPCHSCCGTVSSPQPACAVGSPQKSNPTVPNHSTSWSGEAGASPSSSLQLLGGAQSILARAGGCRHTKGQAGTPMAAHPRSLLTACFATSGLPPSGTGHCRAQLTPSA